MMGQKERKSDHRVRADCGTRNPDDGFVFRVSKFGVKRETGIWTQKYLLLIRNSVDSFVRQEESLLSRGGMFRPSNPGRQTALGPFRSFRSWCE